MSDFKAKMHQNPKFGWGSAPDPAGGSLQRPAFGDGRGWERTGGREGGEARGVLWSPKNP